MFGERTKLQSGISLSAFYLFGFVIFCLVVALIMVMWIIPALVPKPEISSNNRIFVVVNDVYYADISANFSLFDKNEAVGVGVQGESGIETLLVSSTQTEEGCHFDADHTNSTEVTTNYSFIMPGNCLDVTEDSFLDFLEREGLSREIVQFLRELPRASDLNFSRFWALLRLGMI